MPTGIVSVGSSPSLVIRAACVLINPSDATYPALAAFRVHPQAQSGRCGVRANTRLNIAGGNHILTSTCTKMRISFVEFHLLASRALNTVKTQWRQASTCSSPLQSAVSHLSWSGIASTTAGPSCYLLDEHHKTKLMIGTPAYVATPVLPASSSTQGPSPTQW